MLNLAVGVFPPIKTSRSVLSVWGEGSVKK